eukprot:5581382-Prymnesium_polylepis.1
MPVNLDHLLLKVLQQTCKSATVGEIDLKRDDGVKVSQQRMDVGMQRQTAGVHHGYGEVSRAMVCRPNLS